VNARALLEDLRSQDVRLKADGERLVVDAPAGTITDEIRITLAENKPKLLKLLEWERRKLEEADRRGLVIRWSEHPDWIKLHDPLSGEWHEVRAEECLPGVVETANKYRKKGGASALKPCGAARI
jgi:hypothetical protein